MAKKRKPKRNNTTSPKELRQILKKQALIRLRAQGWTYAQIANHPDINLSMTSVRYWVKKTIDELKIEIEEDSEFYIKKRYNLVLERGFKLMESNKPSVSEKGCNIILKANEALRKMGGFDKPLESNVNFNNEVPVGVFNFVKGNEIDNDTKENKE